MEQRRLADSFRSAITGLVFVIRTQRNMRLHLIIACVVIFLGVVLRLNLVELAILTGIIGLVLLAEIINTGVEVAVNLVSEEYHPLAERAKDITAGAVLLSAINAVVVGILLFTKRFAVPVENSIGRLKGGYWQLTLLCLIIVVGAVVMTKLLLRRGTPLSGGMPSGHSALAFSVWALVSLISQNLFVAVLVLPLAVVIAADRITRRTHSVWEVSAGAALGILVVLLLVQIYV